MADRQGAVPKRFISKRNIAKTHDNEPFQRSGKTIRTPPETTEPASQADTSVYLCQICNITDDIRKVRCDRCYRWHHFTCVKVTEDVMFADVWNCPRCQADIAATKATNLDSAEVEMPLVHPSTQPSAVLDLISIENENPSNISGLSLQPELVRNTTKNTEQRSKKANSTSSTMSRRATLALQKLEEERELRRQRDEEYLQQKYSILEDDAISNLSFDDQEVEQQKFDAIRQWANNIPLETSGVPYLNSTIVDPQVSLSAIISSTNQINSKSEQQTKRTIISNLNTFQIEPVIVTSTVQATTLPVWLTNPVAVNQSQNDGKQQPHQQRTVENHQFGGMSSQSIAGVKSFCSTAPNAYLNTAHQATAGDIHQPNLQTTTLNSATSNIMTSLLQAQPNFSQPQVPDAVQMSSYPVQHYTGQPYFRSQMNCGENNQQFGNMKPKLTTRQQQYAIRPNTLGTTQSCSIGQTYSQALPFGFGHSLSQSCSQTQSFGDGQPGGYIPSSGYNQQYQSHTFGISSSMESGLPITMGSTITQPTIGSSAHIPISQPFNLNNPSNGFNQNPMAPVGVPGRLTAEQIAARHVMPKELPYFYGDPTTWLAFKSAYDNSTLECGFSHSENLGRLQKCLKGDAFDLVKTRLIHKDSVPGVIETLRLIFGRPELIIEKMIQDIQKMPAPKEDDLPSLIKFAIAAKNLSTTIQDLGAFEHLKNPTLINSITDKLPTQHRLNWAFQKRTIGDTHIGHLGDWLYQMADVASQVVREFGKPTAKRPEQRETKNKVESSKSNTFVNTQVEKKPTAEVTKVLGSNQKKSCPACKSDKCKKLENCKKFKDAAQTERWSIVKSGKFCGRCLAPHNFYRCQSSKKCSVNGCQASHHTLLHNHDVPHDKTLTGEKTSNANQKSSDTSSPDTQTCNCQRSQSNQRTDKFRIVPVMLHNKGKSVRDYAYLDDGSNMTTIEESLADELELDGSSKELCVDWAFGQTHSTMDSKVVSMKISGYYDNAPQFKMTNVRTVRQLHLPSQSITSSWIEQYPHFKHIPIATYDHIKPRLLIGLQYSKLIVSRETIEGNENEPIVCRTQLGWVVQGPTYKSDTTSDIKRYSLNMCICQTNDNELHQMVKNYFTLENIGTKIPETILESKEIQRAKEILQSTTIKKGNSYETGLLWKHDDVKLPESYGMALKRLKCLEAKMAKDPELKLNLFNQIKSFTEKGYIRKLSKDEIKNCPYRVWYLPTFPVFNPKKPTKVRLVWDGAAKVGQSSLNSNLSTGPDQLVPLPVLLRKFRERKIGVTGDIEEMYHQVKIREEDQHVQRFLWREDVNEEPDIYVMMVMTFGSACSPSSAQYVKNKNAEEFRDKFPRAVEAIVENHYVDDMIECAESVDEAEKLVKDVKLIHKEGGFNIRNFVSNSEELLTRIGEKTASQNKSLNVGDEVRAERVLGMFWETKKDIFTYSLKFTGVNEKMLSGEHCPTKREVLKILMSVFDPLGLIANFLVHGKICRKYGGTKLIGTKNCQLQYKTNGFGG